MRMRFSALILSAFFSAALMAAPATWEENVKSSLINENPGYFAHLMKERPEALNQPFLDGETPITFACKLQLETPMKLRILEVDGFDPEALNEYGETALMTAVFFKDNELARALIEKKGALVDPDTEWSPLMYAATSGNIEAINLLLDKGAKIDRQNSTGVTALYMGAREGRLQAVTTLLEAGAAPDLCTDDGVSPARIARMRHHEKLKDVLAVSTCRISGRMRDANMPSFANKDEKAQETPAPGTEVEITAP